MEPCVTVAARGRGIGKEMVKRGLEILKQEKRCDVACLNADMKHHPTGGFYHELGFRLMKREISFEDLNGITRYDTGEVFIPLCSREIYDFIMTSDEIFRLGRGYW